MKRIVVFIVMISSIASAQNWVNVGQPFIFPDDLSGGNFQLKITGDNFFVGNMKTTFPPYNPALYNFSSATWENNSSTSYENGIASQYIQTDSNNHLIQAVQTTSNGSHVIILKRFDGEVWHAETSVAMPNQFWRFQGFGIDASNNYYLAFSSEYSGGVKVYKFQSGLNTWSELGHVLINGTNASAVQFSVNPLGEVLVLSIGSSNYNLEVAKYSTTIDNWEVLASTNLVSGTNLFNSTVSNISFDNSGLPVFSAITFEGSFFSGERHLKTFRYVGGVWQTVGSENIIFNYPNEDIANINLLSIDSDLFVGYHHHIGGVGNFIEIKKFDGNNWEYVGINGNNVSQGSNNIATVCSLAKGSDLNIYVVYRGTILGENPSEYFFNVKKFDPEALSTTTKTFDEIQIYPNPVTDKLIIKMENFDFLTLVDLSGKQLLMQKEKVVDLSHLSTGVYIINLIDIDGNKSSKKVIKQ
ncbi:T9SS type A sorting domain-containing protein [Flavobacterium sp.]|uniref:T9SS type A sorting domain-containing protein n=1 Tax=Flavobacterium sp. TaxID=239 RepID=UPI00261ADB5C|nr:T9SS type A sorting domain-containing protein [Flavobacterium sp.]MDD3005154.1 T9SS type A sorting domain-containing protein [Flavobacterium sp.]